MKRSEALAIIYDAFYDCLDIPNDSFVIKKDFDEFILNQLEEAGMLPPKSTPEYHKSGKQLETKNVWDKE